MWHRLAQTLKPWYEQFWDDRRKSAVLNGDETGWFLNGVLVWLWCFCTSRETFYAIDESRGHASLERFFVEEFQGVLVTDFWRAYDIVTDQQQKCWAHLLRDLQVIDESPSGTRDDWLVFAKKLRRIDSDAVRLAAKIDVLPESKHASKVCAWDSRMSELAHTEWTHVDARRLAKRLVKDGASLLMFAEFAEVPSTNNRAEREIRPAVLMRKGCYGSQSERGVETRAILMSVFRTLKVRGLDPLAELQKALEVYTVTGKLPPLPEGNRSAG
jgi:transposase